MSKIWQAALLVLIWTAAVNGLPTQNIRCQELITLSNKVDIFLLELVIS